MLSSERHTCIQTRYRSIRKRYLSVIALVTVSITSVPGAVRTVIDKEYGQYYGFGPSATSVGMAVLQPHDSYFGQMRGDAIKAPHGHFQHFAPADTGDDFPYDQLKAYEAAEIAAGRPPIFVTATYAGKKRPVLFEFSLAPDSSNRPTTTSSGWQQAVNLRDDRFIRFYANVYLKNRLWAPVYQTYWAASDNCSFRYNNYGVIDDNGIYQNTITWDQPFAQSDSDFLDSIKYFFTRLKQIAPDVHVVGNEGSMNDESRFSDVWAGFDGTIREEINAYFQGDSYSRNEIYKYFTRYQWEGPAGKAAVLRSLLPRETSSTFSDLMRTGYSTYLIFRGDNFFFAPRFDDGTAQGVPLSDYAQMRNNLGLPTATAQSSSATNDGYRLYSRTTEGGVVYLNITGQSQTVTLPAGQFYDRNGSAVTKLTIPDLKADYAVTQNGNRAERPEINPRIGGTITGPVSVTLSTSSGSGTIRYTLDGSDPSANSTVYSGPISLTSSATIKAKTSCSGCLDSFTTSASYTITGTAPTVQFFAASDSGTAAFPAYYPIVALSNPSGAVVTVSYSVGGGSATSGVDFTGSGGTLTFQPGVTYQSIPVNILNTGSSVDKTVAISLQSASGAGMGANSTFTYTILGGGVQAPVAGHAPVLSGGSPAGVLPSSTTTATLSLTADEPSTCRYATTAGIAFGSMPFAFGTTGNLAQSTALSGLTAGKSYSYYVRCQSGSYTNTGDYTVSFSIAAQTSSGHAPILSNGAPSGILASTTKSATISVATDEAATCKYATTAGVKYSSMTNSFSVTGGTQHSKSVSLSAGKSYNYYVRCSDAYGNVDAGDYLISFSVAAATGTASTFQPLRIRAGGTNYVDSQGQTWHADSGYSVYGGSSQIVIMPIGGTSDPALYQTARLNPSAYEFTVPNGTHTVKLKFAETVVSGAGQRVFDVVLNGQFVLNQFDIFADSGWGMADDKSFPVSVTNGMVTLVFYSESGAPPMISGIEID